MSSVIRILVVGGSDAVPTRLADCMRNLETNDGFETTWAPTVAESVRVVPVADCVVLWVGTRSEHAAARDVDDLTSLAPGKPVVVVIDGVTQATALALLRRGAQDCLSSADVRDHGLDRAVRFAIARGAAIDNAPHSERHYRSIVEALGEGVVVQSDDGTVLSVNRRAEEILGAAAEHSLGRPSGETGWAPCDESGRLLEPEERPGYRCMISGQPVTDVLLTVALPDGAKRWLETSCYPLRHTGETRAHGIVTVIRDVTAQRHAEELIRFHALLLDAVGQAVVATDLTGRIVYWNHGAERLFGWTTSEAVGKSVLQGGVLGIDRRADIVSRVALGETWTGDVWATHRDGTRVAILVTNTPVCDPHGNVTGLVSVSTDISERRAAEDANRRLSSIVESSTDAIYCTDLDGMITSWNGGATALYGYAEDDILGRHVSILVPDHLLAHSEQLLQQVRDGNVYQACDTQQRRQDGSLCEVSLTGSPVLDSRGRPVAKATIARDIGDRKNLERALARDRDRLADAQRISKLGSFDRDPVTGQHVWSAEMYRMFGVDPEWTPDDQTYLATVHPEDRPRIGVAIQVALRDREPLHAEHRIVLPDQTVRWVSAHVGMSPDGRVVGAVLDITERKRAQEEMTFQSLHDPLTGLPNRTLLEQRLGRLIARKRHEPAALMFLDIDRFKVINDGMGHAAGDELLVAIADRLTAWAHPGDTVARFGGDEFVILCQGVGTMDDARRRADEVVALTAQAFNIGQREILVTVSVGLTEVGTGVDVEQVLSEADAAMYKAKELGRAVVVVADDALRNTSMARLEMETSLRQALEHDEFRVYYQPVVDLNTEEILGYEALVRWQHPQRGLVYPDQFIGLAEETGLIVPIGRWVLGEALNQLAAWRRAFPCRRRFMAVNLSALQLYSGELAADVEAALSAAGVDADLLHLEITETSLMDIDRAAASLSSLAEIGVRIELDDFGTGYSSLSYLQKLPIHTIKIDRSFMSGIGAECQNSSIVRAIVSLGDSLGMQVLAEGVETVCQRDQLRALGCEMAQGYLWSKPLPAAELDALIGDAARFDTGPSVPASPTGPVTTKTGAIDSAQAGYMLDRLSERVVRYGADDHIVTYCNTAWARPHHSTPAELIGRSLDDLLSADELEGLRFQLSRLSPGQPTLTDPIPRPASDGSGRWFSWADQLLEDGREVLTVGRDVTDRHLAQMELAESDARFRPLVEGSADVVFCFSLVPHPRFTYFSPSVKRILGYSPAELVDNMALFIDIIDDEGRQLIAPALSGGAIPERFDMRFRHADGRTVIGEMQITLLPDGLQGVGRDVTEIRALQAELVALALRDPLTGLANRRLLDELLTGAISRTQRTGHDLAVAFLDLDDFKLVNDTYGHDKGDVVLREVVRRMLTVVRSSDVVARVGGDEFVIVHEAGDNGVEGFVERMNEALASPIDIGSGVSVVCPASIGEVDTRTIGWDPEALVTAADAAMYEVKHRRRSARTVAADDIDDDDDDDAESGAAAFAC